MRRFLPLLLAAAAFAALTIVWILTDRRASQRVYDDYSTANTSEKGLSLASGYLAKQRKVAMLTKPLARVDLERNAVVFRVAEELPVFFDPEQLDRDEMGPPKPKQKPLLSEAEEQFLRDGGRMIIAAETGVLEWALVSDATPVKVFPIWRGVEKLAVPESNSAFISLRPRMHAVFMIGPHVLLARERIGNGELFVLSAPEILRNKNLASADHLALLTELAGTKRPVYFDEVLHGIISGDGALALMKEWNLGPFLVLLAIAAVLVFWREGRRIGPAEEDHRETRSDAIDLVRSLGALYREVSDDAETIRLYHDALVRTVAHTSGLRGEALHKRVAELTGGFIPPAGRGKMPAAVFRKQLERINDGFAAHRSLKASRSEA